MREDEEKKTSKRNTVLYSTLEEKRRAKGDEADLFNYALSTFFLVILLS